MGHSVIWQITRSCELGCHDCLVADERVSGRPELSTFESYKTIDQIATSKPQRFVISGGDPLARKDIFELVQYARRRGLDPAVNVSPTKALTPENINKLRRNGLTRLVFSLNGSSPEKHDAVSGIAGSFAATVRGMRWAHDAGIAVEVNTLIARETVADLAAIAEVIDPFGIEAWNIYFLVPVASMRKLHEVSSHQANEALEALAAIASIARYSVRVIEPPQEWSDFAGYVGKAGDVVVVTADGDVRPSEFLPISAGNLRERRLGTIMRAMEAPV
jgi:MoaA/NifB/PqqE/SkfB family radical SAM enzyme